MMNTTMMNTTIQSTSNYSDFVILPENRRIVPKYLKKLIFSIQENNMLRFNPILVNRKKEVIDGQHRLEAAKILSVPIFFLIIDIAGLKEIILLNSNIRTWILSDYLHAYMILGNYQYIRLEQFSKQYNLTLIKAICILENNFREPLFIRDRFKKGNFMIKDYEKAEHFASFYNEVKLFCIDTCYLSRDFYRAVYKIYESGIDLKDFLFLLKKYTIKIERQGSLKSYLHFFEDYVINYKKRKKILRLL